MESNLNSLIETIVLDTDYKNIILNILDLNKVFRSFLCFMYNQHTSEYSHMLDYIPNPDYIPFEKNKPLATLTLATVRSATPLSELNLETNSNNLEHTIVTSYSKATNNAITVMPVTKTIALTNIHSVPLAQLTITVLERKYIVMYLITDQNTSFAYSLEQINYIAAKDALNTLLVELVGFCNLTNDEIKNLLNNEIDLKDTTQLKLIFLRTLTNRNYETKKEIIYKRINTLESKQKEVLTMLESIDDDIQTNKRELGYLLLEQPKAIDKGSEQFIKFLDANTSIRSYQILADQIRIYTYPLFCQFTFGVDDQNKMKEFIRNYLDAQYLEQDTDKVIEALTEGHKYKIPLGSYCITINLTANCKPSSQTQSNYCIPSRTSTSFNFLNLHWTKYNCLGSFRSRFLEYSNPLNLMGLTTTWLQYLQTINIIDTAGKYIIQNHNLYDVENDIFYLIDGTTAKNEDLKPLTLNKYIEQDKGE